MIEIPNCGAPSAMPSTMSSERVSVPVFVDARDGVSGLIADGGAEMLEEFAAKGANGVTIRDLVGDDASEDEGKVVAAVEASARALSRVFSCVVSVPVNALRG